MKTFNHYILVDRQPVQVDDYMEFIYWRMQNEASMRVEYTYCGPYEVSTVFLGLAHGYHNGRPVVFETLVFGPTGPDYGSRYCTWDEAVAGHARFVSTLVN